MQEAIDKLNREGFEVQTASRGTVTEQAVGYAFDAPAYFWLEGTRPGPHICPSFFISCPQPFREETTPG